MIFVISRIALLFIVFDGADFLPSFFCLRFRCCGVIRRSCCQFSGRLVVVVRVCVHMPSLVRKHEFCIKVVLLSAKGTRGISFGLFHNSI